MFSYQLISSMLLLFPLYLMLSSSFGRNVNATRLLSGIDFSLIIDFVYHWRGALSVYLVNFVMVCCVLVLAFIFLSGGFWAVLRDELAKRASNSRMERFFGYCGKYFWGMLKISLFSVIIYFLAVLVFLVLNSVLTAAVGRVSLWHLSSWHVVILIDIAIFLFFLANMTGDYLRILLVESQGDRFFGVMGKAFKFLLTNFWRALSLYYLLSLILAGLILVYLGLDRVMDRMPDIGFFVFVSFIIQQTLVLFRSFGRLVFYSSQLAFYQERTKSVSAAA